jgi:truncated hemoglobin YjbI
MPDNFISDQTILEHFMSDTFSQESALITQIVESFYKEATVDILIGHHFRKIASIKGADPLRPPMEAFKDHLPKIEAFWRIQLGIEHPDNEQGQKLDLIGVHKSLKIRKGEVGRWMVLFRQTLESFESATPEWIVPKLREKLAHFEQVFLHHPQLFS